MTAEIMNVKQVSEYIHVNEKKVYSLIAKEGLPGTKITGKWLFPKKLVDEWLTKSLTPAKRGVPEGEGVLMVVGSDDPLLEELLGRLNRSSASVLAYFGNAGSRGGLRAVSHGQGHLASSHLWDAESDTYNRCQVTEVMPGRNVLLVNVAYREQGFLLAPGNPKSFQGVDDLTREDVALVNRQQGSGTRALLEFHLSELGIPSADIRGYEREVESHFAVGLSVLKGEADVGIAIRCVAAAFSLDFIPIREERYDLVVPQGSLSVPSVQRLLELLSSSESGRAAGRLGGYSMRDTGRIVSVN